MSESLSQEQQQELKEVFDYFDKEKKGQLAPKDVSLLFRSLGEDMSEQQASNLCSGGGLSFSAFLDNRQQKWAAQQAGNILRHAFSILDWSGQGYVDANDLRRLLTSQGERLTQSEVEDLIRDAGGGQQVDYNAFVETMIRKNV